MHASARVHDFCTRIVEAEPHGAEHLVWCVAGTLRYLLTTIVGDTTGFMFVDSFPSESAWVAMRGAMKTEEGKALDKEFEAVCTCSHNALYESEQTMAPE